MSRNEIDLNDFEPEYPTKRRRDLRVHLWYAKALILFAGRIGAALAD